MKPAVRRKLGRLRLASQLVETSGPPPHRAVDVVRQLTAMQAQDFPGAKWAVGLRLPGATDSDIEDSLADGSNVRSWPLRGTLHFVAAEDLGWMLSLSADRMIKRSATIFANEGLTAKVLARAGESARGALAGGRSLSRDELYRLLQDSGVSTVGQARYHAVWYLCQTGALCLGPPNGKTQTFVLLDEWVPDPRRLERDDALGELAGRYFRSHGPATVRDFSWWSALTLTEARKGLTIARRQLAALEVDGLEYFLSPDLPGVSPDLPGEPSASGTRLLPGFDEYLLGYGDRRVALADEHSPLVFPGKNGMFLPTIVVDGAVVGTWRRTATSRQVAVTAQAFEPLPARIRAAVDLAAAEYARFVGLTLSPDA